MFRQDDRRAHQGSQFGVRVAVLGGFALLAFSIIFFRLWYLEVLSGEAYLREANSNRVREFKIQAPRGEILDRNGRVLVDNRSALSLQIQPDELPRNTPERNRQLRKLADVADMSTKKVKQEIRTQSRLLPASPVTIKRDVDQDLVYYLREREDQFPGVTAEEVYVRHYPNGTMGAHLFGFVSEVNEEQLAQPQYQALDLGDRIGANGVELQYDNVLRGRNGAVRVQVDAMGEPRGQELSRKEPKAGENLVLTLDKKVQMAGEEAIASSGLPSAFVAMNVNDGSIVGMGSYPTFDPSVYTPPVSTNEVESLVEAEDDPLFNKATQSAYPTGSTFKLITASMGLEEGYITPEETISDSGSFEYGGRSWINAGEEAYGIINVTDALRVSSDIFFYLLGKDSFFAGNEDLQNWAMNYGFGSLTGVDLPGEGSGLVPTPEWRNELYKEAADPDSCAGRTRDYAECGETDRPYGPGDDMNFSVGQGDLQATPLQLAVAYAALANGGQIVRPHVADRAEDSAGRDRQVFDPAPRREIPLSEDTRGIIMEGLRQAAMEPGGTSYGLFGGFPIEIAGKTGTAERGIGNPDQSWYAAVAPYDDPEIVVVATVEGGGFGAEAAAPVARDILSRYFGVGSRDIEETGEEIAAD